MIEGAQKIGFGRGKCGGQTLEENKMTTKQISIRDLLKVGAHFGHRTRYWHPSMAPYIYGVRDGIHIINLEKTQPLMQKAIDFVYNVASKGGRVLFVGTKATATDVIKKQAERCGMPYVDYRWLGGMLTNYKTIRQSIKRLKDLEAMSESNGFEGFTKKERLTFMREKDKLEKTLGGIKDMGGLPEAIFVIDAGREKITIEEAKRLSIPVIGVVDTNQNPSIVDYLIPANDDAYRAINFYTSTVADTILQAKQEIEEAMAGDIKADDKAEGGAKRKVVTKKISLKRTAKKDESAKGAVETKEEKIAEKKAEVKEEKSTAAKKAPAKKTAAKKEEAAEDKEAKPAAKKKTAAKKEDK